MHESPFMHWGQTGPPQSVSVSIPFCIVSMHVASGGAQVPVSQLLLTQSEFAMHVSPFMHWGQVGPPQSVSVSIPFCIVSVHVGPGGAHVPPMQLLLTQSEFTPHMSPFMHWGQSGPPQSTSVSIPLCVMSEQLGIAPPVPPVPPPAPPPTPPMPPLPTIIPVLLLTVVLPPEPESPASAPPSMRLRSTAATNSHPSPVAARAPNMTAAAATILAL
jgi:hypothetical protein